MTILCLPASANRDGFDLSMALRCPDCHRAFSTAALEPLPTGTASLERWQARCRCGCQYRVAWRKRPVADDERRAADTRWWREVARMRRGAERVAAVAVLRHLGSMSMGREG